MRYILSIDYEKCTGCRMCVMACSLEKTNTFNPLRSRIGLLRWEEEGRIAPVVCLQCEDPICSPCCPVDALVKNPENGVVELNSQVCVGCKVCMMICPLGGTTLDPIEGKVIKCDLCGGHPKCVEVCETGALQYVRADRATMGGTRRTLEKIVKSITPIQVGSESSPEHS